MGSRSAIRTAPLSARSNPHITRIIVVFPAPSGPMMPNISPRSTAHDTFASAVVEPYRLVTLSRLTAAIDRNLHFDRHSHLEHARAIVDADLDAIDELRSLFRGLYVARRE